MGRSQVLRTWAELSMAWLQMTDVGALCALRLRFILDSPIPLSLGYRLLVTGTYSKERKVLFHNKATKAAKIRETNKG